MLNAVHDELSRPQANKWPKRKLLAVFQSFIGTLYGVGSRWGLEKHDYH